MDLVVLRFGGLSAVLKNFASKVSPCLLLDESKFKNLVLFTVLNSPIVCVKLEASIVATLGRSFLDGFH